MSTEGDANSKILEQNNSLKEVKCTTNDDKIITNELSSISNINGSDVEEQVQPPAAKSSNDNLYSTMTGTTGVSPCAVENKFFFEDEVFQIDKKGRVKFGLIIETADSNSADEDDDEDDSLDNGKVRVAWYPGAKEVVVMESSLGLADRSLMPGDVVRRLVAGKDTQRGFCCRLYLKADVKVLDTKYVLRNVDAERFLPLIRWQIDGAVCLDSWVGSVRDYEDKAIMRSPEGGRIEISSNEYYSFCDHNGSSAYSPQIFYPGNIVLARLSSYDKVKNLTPDIPLRVNRNGKPLPERYIVENVYTESVWVNWQCKALTDDENIHNSLLEQPNPCVSGRNLERLKSLSLFDPCMIQLNDRNYVTIQENDLLVNKSKWMKEETSKYRNIFEDQRKQNFNDMFVHNLSGSANNSHHAEKRKRAVHDSDKGPRNKKFPKFDKIGCTTSNKEKTQHTDVANEPTTQKDSKHTPTKNADSSWITDDGSDDSEIILEEIILKPNKLIETKKAPVTGAVDSKLDAEQDNNELINKIKDRIIKKVELETNVKEEELGEQWHKFVDNKLKAATLQIRKPLLIAKDSGSTTTISTNSSQSSRDNAKPPSRPLFKNKKRKTPLKRYVNPDGLRVVTNPTTLPQAGDKVMTETLLVYGVATVIWQDGTIEENIPSTQLFPIHHLDNHEFFPGDYVVSGKEDSDSSFRDYGVVQSVDHRGRIARVKWFTTYASAEEPRPTYNGESEVSVYDLKDHPDFQYRPGTMVICVANFTGDANSGCAGQIMDNYTDGKLRIWWVNGSISFCWPQDVFEVGQFDQADWEQDSDDSWETESENSEDSDNSSRKDAFEESRVLSYTEHARVGISHLEELFGDNPNLQNADVLRKLLTVYKSCRGLDRLLNTSYFHENNFQDLLTPIRVRNYLSLLGSAQDRKKRLFNNVSSGATSKAIQQIESIVNQTIDQMKQEEVPNVSNGVCSTPLKDKQMSEIVSTKSKTLNELYINDNVIEVKDINVNTQEVINSTVITHDEKTDEIKGLTPTSQNDSGNYSIKENGDASALSSNSISELIHADANASITKTPVDGQTESNTASNISTNVNDNNNTEKLALRMCALLKEQLVKCLNEVREKVYKAEKMNVNEVFDFNLNPKATPVNSEDEEDDEDDEECDGEDDNNGDGGNENVEGHDDAESETDDDDDGDADNEDEEESDEANVANTDADNVIVAKSPKDLKSSEQLAPLKIEGINPEGFQMLPNASSSHKYFTADHTPNNAKQYFKAVQREHRMLKTSLPPGVFVRVYEDRLDLMSVMIEGPENTPYENGLFFFDIQLGREYPRNPPLCHYISFCSDRLNPNLYEDGKVCVSLLGTWSGRDTEIWGPGSSILQLIVSIQGLILVAEPYYNEAGYEKQKGTKEGSENTRMYNEMVIIKMVQATTKLLTYRSDVFQSEITEHYKENGYKMYERILKWAELTKMLSNCDNNNTSDQLRMTSEKFLDENKQYRPQFSLLPASRGFILTLEGLLDKLKAKLDRVYPKSNDSVETLIS